MKLRAMNVCVGNCHCILGCLPQVNVYSLNSVHCVQDLTHTSVFSVNPKKSPKVERIEIWTTTKRGLSDNCLFYKGLRMTVEIKLD